ncbi:FERM domain-containing protein 8-like isoform X2 [Eriocheir sinensis]|uniref:FERM domain-containing protein 8-like isoform X2 n=1 Tax=Eriocheir sinensis TaxID=95602 RepID=UPI0021C983D6|nr:FERM domain-containing protein 8-like isoform X2 [Eriocheir sinensis]
MAHTAKYKPMPLGKMSEYGFEEDDSGGLGGHQTDAGQNYITVIPVEYPTRRTYGDYDAFPRSATIARRPRGETDAFPRSATISREFLRERAAADFLRSDYNKGSADHLDKAAGFYPSIPPPAFDVPPLTLDPDTRRPSSTSHMLSQTTTSAPPPSNNTLPSHNTLPPGHTHSQLPPTSTTSTMVGGVVNHPNVTQQSQPHQPHQDEYDKHHAKVDHERKANKALPAHHHYYAGTHTGRVSCTVEVCVFLHSRVAVRLRLEDGARITAQELQAMVIEEEDVALPKQAMEVFALWLVSPVLEIQLKPHQRALEVRRHWGELLKRFTQVPVKPQDARYAYEPKMVLRRNVFFSKRDEVKIRDAKILELLYEEAQWNMRSARYPCELSDYEMLAGIQSRLELGPYDHTTHTPSFFRRRLLDYLPEHACRLKLSDLVSFSSKSTPEIRIIEQFRSIPSNVTARKLVRKYLEFSWSLPYYGSAFFHGQIEQASRGMGSWLPRPDIPVLVTINATGVSVIDPKKSTVLLSLRYDELSWDFARPSNERIATCLPCLFLQFAVVENGRRYSKLLQIFSKQAVMMDALISTFVDELKRRAAQYPDDLEGHMLDHGTEVDDVLVPLSTVSRKEVPESVLCNKLHRLSLATFSEDGRCVGTMGSWQFSR